MNNMLTLEEIKNFLEVDQQEIEKYLKRGKLHAYKIGGTYLRFRKEEVLNLHFELLPNKNKGVETKVPVFVRLRDFWRFNNFYIISLLLVLVIALVVFRI